MSFRSCLALLFLLTGGLASGMDSVPSKLHRNKSALVPKGVNIIVIGVRTTDNVQVMLLTKYVNESRILKQTIHYKDGKGLLAIVDATQEEFNKMIPCLKLGAELTRIKEEVSALENELMREELKPNVDYTRDQLVKTIAGYDKRAWKACLKTAIKLRIDEVHNAAVVVGKKNGWLKKPSEPVLVKVN